MRGPSATAKRGLLAPLLLFLALPVRAAQTKVWSAPADLDGAVYDGARPAPFERGLVELLPGRSSGTVVTPGLPAPLFDSLVASWNAETPAGTSVEVWGQVQLYGQWTEWYQFGRWDAQGGTTFENDGEHVWMDVDTLKVKAGDRRATALRLKAVLLGGKDGPVLQSLSAATANATAPLLGDDGFEKGPWVRELDVPMRSQIATQSKFSRDICSPTSVSMVAAFWGKARPVEEVALAVRDRRTERFGVWPFNTAQAGRMGLRAHVARLNRIRDLQQEIAAGRPVVTSISFGEGELDGSPMRRTKGHLLVVRGFTEDGDVIVNDPAAPEDAGARRVYKRGQFRDAWLKNKQGLAYIIGPRFPVTLAVGAYAADLTAAAKSGRGAPGDRDRLSQLLSGEAARVTAAKGAFARVEALEQAHVESGQWGPYAGWIDARALATPSPAMTPNAVVNSTEAAFPLGTKVMRLTRTGAPLEGEGESTTAVRLFNGTQTGIATAHLTTLPVPAGSQRAEALRAAGSLVGRPYVWGGRNSHAAGGVDCSGLTSLAHRAAGLDIPRDSRDQFLKAAQLDRAAAPGDLFFLTKPGKPEQINHVGFYTGEDGLLEAVEEAGVRRTTFQQRFGKPLSGLKAGDTVGGRTIWFGTFFLAK